MRGGGKEKLYSSEFKVRPAIGSWVWGQRCRGVWSTRGDLLASRFIEDEDVPWAKEGASKAEKLFLAVRQVDLVNVRVQATLLLQHREELDALQRCQDVFVGVGPGWVGVQSYAALEEKGVLGDAIDARADLPSWKSAQVDSVHSDVAAGQFHHSEEAHDH